MLSTIKIGDKQIPILDTYSVEGSPAGLYPYQLPNNEKKPISSSDAYNYWENLYPNAYQYAEGYAHTEADEGGHPVHSSGFSSHIHNGTTDLHDGASFYLEDAVVSGGGTYPVPLYTWACRYMTGTTTDYTTSNFLSFNGIPNWPSIHGTFTRENRMFAIRIKYTGVTYYNYQIVRMWKLTTQESTYQNTSYGIDGNGAFNMYYWRRNDINAYYEEEEVPEDPFEPVEPEPYEPTPVVWPTSDPITVPTIPTIGVTSAGFINVYNPGIGSLQNLGNILFPDVTISTDIVDTVNNLVTVVMNQNLINYVIDCHVLPVTPTVGSNKEIYVGFRDTGINVPAVTSDYVRYTCGSISLAEHFHSFADYIGTRSKLYIPFIGFVDMLPEYWQAGSIGVEYMFNVIDGSFMAYVVSTSSKSHLTASVIAQYGGTACMHFPLTGLNYASMVSGIVGAAASIATAGTVGAALGGAASALNVFAQGGNVNQSNGYNSTAALMGVRTPYLLIERISPAYPGNYGHDIGYTSNISTLLTNVSGYTEITNIDLSGVPFTSDELQELRQLLEEGVYF